MGNNQTLAARIVSADAIKALVEGSNEHLGVALDSALKKSGTTFAKDGDVARIATFHDHMIVGTSVGEYFNVKFENKDGELILLAPGEKISVPVVSSSNAAKSVKEFSLAAVDALMSEGSEKSVGRLLALVDLQDQQQVVEARDYPAEALASVVGRPWREAFSTQSKEITRQVVDKLESIRSNALEAKYKPMYETDEIPEEKFEDYRAMAIADLNVLSDRLRHVHEAAEAAYLPFRASLSKDDLDESEEEVLSHFCFFSEDLIQDLGEVRSLVADTIDNEQCVMCLGQVYDTLAESLSDYEIAGSFVQRMTGAFDDAA